MGTYVKEPQVKMHWKYSPARDTLVQYDNLADEYVKYTRDIEGRQLCSELTYYRQQVLQNKDDHTHYASVIQCADDKFRIHSHVLAIQAEEVTPATSVETLQSYPTQEMWENLYVDDNGEWIEEGLMTGTLDIAHDGSYQPKTSTEVCLTAVWVRCRRTKKTLFCSFAEHSLHAWSYRSEILGAIAAQLVLKASARNRLATYPDVPIYCDNRGVLNHGSEPERELKKNKHSSMHYTS